MIAAKLYQFIKSGTSLLTTLISLSLLLVVLGLCVEVVLRKLFSLSLPGIHEFAGYFLAALSTIGLSQALLAKAHIRIDMLYQKVNQKVRWTMDIVALSALSLIAVLLAIYAYPVLAKSINNESLSNTPLATPLWIPQLIWYLGIIWFCLAALVSLLYAATLLVKSQYREFSERFGAINEVTNHTAIDLED